MVKVDIIRRFELKSGLSFHESEKIINEIIEMMKQTLESGEEILISGFGKFELKDKKARPGRDPKTKTEYEITARRVVAFSQSKVWRNELKE